MMDDLDLWLVPDLDLICFSVLLFPRDESESYLAGLGTVGMEVLDQVSKLDAVVVPAAGQYGLLASTAAAIKHLNSRVLVIVSGTMWHVKTTCSNSLDLLRRQKHFVFIILFYFIFISIFDFRNFQWLYFSIVFKFTENCFWYITNK